MLSLSFFITSLIVVLIPGTGVIYTLSSGISGGRKVSIFAAIGCTVGIIPHMTVGILSLVFFQTFNELMFNLVKLAGAVYLIYLGFNMLRSKQSINMEGSDKPLSGFEITTKGIFINLLNPKLTIFFLSFIPQYVNRTEGKIFLQGIVLGLLFMAITLFVFILYGLFAGAFHYFIKTSPQRIILTQRIFGVSFIGFAIHLIFSRL